MSNFDVRQLLQGLRQAERKALDAAARGLDQAAEHVLGTAQDLAPVKSGDLKGSATSTPAVASRRGISKTLGFNTDYAAAVHEGVTTNFNTDANPLAQAKFLETPLRERAPQLAKSVADAMKEAL